MDEKHVALLRRHRETFMKSVEVERLFPMLEEIISPSEIGDMKLLSSSQARVEKLLDILPGKGRPAFTYLCLALEKTYPHLLTVMCIGRGDPTGSSPSTISPYTSESDLEERNTFPRMLMPRPTPINNRSFVMPGSAGSREHGASLQSSLDSDPEESLNRSKGVHMGPSDRSLPERGLADRGIPHRDYRKLQDKCQEAMLKLETLTRQNEETLRMLDQARKETDYYCKQHRTAMNNGDQLRGKLQGLQQEYADLMSERNQVQQEINDLRQRHEDDAKELSDLRVQSREVVTMMGQPDVKRMYDMAMDRYETLKREYDNLQKRFSEVKGSHGSNMNKIDRLQEDIDQLQNQIDGLRSEKDVAVKERNALKQQCTSAIREYEKVRREQEDYRQQEFKTLQDARLLKQAIKKAQVERDQAVREHRLVMSERDVVHKEIEKLQDEAQLESTKRKAAEEKFASAQNDYGQLHLKFVDTLREHDQAVKRISDLSERYREMINNSMMHKKEREGILHELRKYEEELHVARHERKEALDQLEEVVQERYKAKQEQEMTSNEYKEVNKEVEGLRRKVESLTREHKESVQESENSKRLRDWAYMERDKIVAERESIRTLCDKLRRERDRSVSDYAEALRKTDDMERKKNEVTKELHQVKQNVIQQEEKEARMRQLIAHHSRDSAIDADSQEWHMEMVELETVMDDGDMTMLGFDIGDCQKDHQFPDDCSVVITKVDKGSIADGRLRVNDCVVRVNNVDLTNGGDRSRAVQAVKNSRGVVNMLVKRRRPSGVRFHPVKLFYGGKEHGLVLENGIFISRIVPGSAAAKEGSLLPGDRILYVDGYLVENKSVPEVEKMLSSSSESVLLSVVRVTGLPMSSSTSPTVESIQSHDTSSSKSSLTPFLEIPEQKSDRNGNLQQQQSAKAMSAQDDKVKKLLRDYVEVKRRESMHSRESSHESNSANSGEQTPRASSREDFALLDQSRDKRVGDYPQNSLKRGEISQRERIRSFAGQSMPNGQFVFEVNDNVRHSGYHSRDTSRGSDAHSYHGNAQNTKPSYAREAPHRSVSQDSGQRESGHSGDANKDGQQLTNGDMRSPGSKDRQTTENPYFRGESSDGLNSDFPPVQFIRDCPQRESFHIRDGRGPNRKRTINGGGAFDVWSDTNPFVSYPPHEPSSGPPHKSRTWDECNNGAVNNRLLKAPNHANGNVQQGRPRSDDCSFRNNHTSLPHEQQRPFEGGHMRSQSTSSGRDIERDFKANERSSGVSEQASDGYVDRPQKHEHNDNVFHGFPESKTVPMSMPKQHSPVKDHSTWPKSRAPPDFWKGGHKKPKRTRMPIPDMNGRTDNPLWDDHEPIVKPTPPSRTSSFKASLRHVKSPSGSSSGSESRRQSSVAGSEGKGQGSMSPQSPTVKVSPVTAPSHSQPSTPQEALKHNGQDSLQQNGFLTFSSQSNIKQDYVPMTKVDIPSVQPSVFRPVVSQVQPLPSESAILPRVESQLHAKLPIPYTSKRPQEPLQIVRADLVETVPPWDTMSLPSEPGTPSHYNTWVGHWHPSKPTAAQVIIQPINVPSYRVDSYQLPPVNSNRQSVDGPAYPPPSPTMTDFTDQFYPPGRGGDRTHSRTSLPENRRRRQISSVSTNSEYQLDIYSPRPITTEYSTGSLPVKFERISLPGYRPSPGPSSSSDITSNSGHSSPTSPSLPDDSPFSSRTGSLEPSITITSQGGPNDPRLIEIEKTLEPLGFGIKEGSRGGIFVNSVTDGSLADRGGLKYGDQILEFNGINLRRATYELAVHILTRAGNSISIKAQYNKKKIGDDQRDSMCSSTQSTPIASQTSTRTNSPTPTITPPTPRASRTQSILSTTSSVMPNEHPRFTFLKKSGGSLGVGMYGGNKVGIFVSEIAPMSVADKTDGLRVGDQILEYNGVDLRNATAEQAAVELQKPAEDITILVQHNLSKYNNIQNHSCDELFIKALVDFSAEKQGQLTFKRDDVLMVDDTMYNGSLGVWNAWLINQEGNRTVGGQILSKSALDREMVRRRLLTEGMQEEELRTASSRRSSGPARRSFLKRKKKHQHNNSKDSRELSEGSITDVPVHEDAIAPTYLRVDRLDMHIKRPVILLGPLVEKVAQKMMEESPNKYSRGFPKMVQSSHQLLEKDIESGLIVNYQRKDNMFEVVHASTVKEICKRGCHCILDSVSPAVAERLQRLQLHPIIIFVKFKNIKNIKDQKDPHLLRERVTHKQAKELLESASKIEQDYRSLFSEIVQGGSLASISTRVKKSIDSEQRKPIWIPSTQPL